MLPSSANVFPSPTGTQHSGHETGKKSHKEQKQTDLRPRNQLAELSVHTKKVLGGEGGEGVCGGGGGGVVRAHPESCLCVSMLCGTHAMDIDGWPRRRCLLGHHKFKFSY